MIPRIPKDTGPTDTSKEAKILIDYFNFKYDSPLSKNNKISFYTDGEEKFKALLMISIRLKKQSMLNIIPS